MGILLLSEINMSWRVQILDDLRFSFNCCFVIKHSHSCIHTILLCKQFFYSKYTCIYGSLSNRVFQ